MTDLDNLLTEPKARNPREKKNVVSKWNQTRRLEFIDFRLAIDGHLNRIDLVEFFNISVPQASLDIATYHNLLLNSPNPRQNLVYDRRLKIYQRTEDFIPLFPKVCSPQSYLNDLLSSAKGELIESRNYFGFIPNIGVCCFNPPRRNIRADVLFNLLEAIRTRKAVHISYKSLKSEGNIDYLIAPHGLAFDGVRWHVRGYCYDHHNFRDYVISRVANCAVPNIPAPNDRFPDPMGNGFREVGTSGRDDKDWNELIDLVIKANPELPLAARRAIEFDYGMDPDGSLVYPCRKALLFYALRFLRLTKEDKALPPECRQIALDNEAEVFRRLAGGN